MRAALAQVRSLSKKEPKDIEAAAVPPEALDNGSGEGAVKLWGEDALLDWPGALVPGEPRPRCRFAAGLAKPRLTKTVKPKVSSSDKDQNPH